jgi:hypothetical protein
LSATSAKRENSGKHGVRFGEADRTIRKTAGHSWQDEEMKGMERRTRVQERFTCFLDVLINGTLSCKAFDISEGGIYLRTDHLLKTGDVVNLRLTSGRSALELKARVKHVVEGFGMGLMFIDLDTVLKSKIMLFLEEIKQST